MDALAGLADSITPTTRLHGLVDRGTELIGLFCDATYVGILIHSAEREESGHWPQTLEETGLEERVRALWSGETKTDNEIGTILRRGPNRIGAVLARLATPDTPSKSLFRSIASQLSLVFENALLLRATVGGTKEFDGGLDQRSDQSRSIIYGEPATLGSAAGRLLKWDGGLESDDYEVDSSGIEELDKAFLESRNQISQLKKDATLRVDDTVATLFDAHLLMLSDPQFIGRIRTLTESGESAVRSVRSVVDDLSRTLSAMDDPRFREKAQDVRDLGVRLIRNLRGEATADRSYSNVIVVAETMYPSEFVSLAAQRVGGIVFVGSGITAHLSILARSLEVPTLLTQDRSLLEMPDDSFVAVDADGGRVLIHPTETETEALREASKLRRAELDDVSVLSRVFMHLEQHELANQPKIWANVNLFHDADRARNLQADGIGLYRSEFPFIIRSDYVSEEEQFGIYRRIANVMPDCPLNFRTADIGGDKILPWADLDEANPFLGVRGIRFSLAYPAMFADQLRAMLRAGFERDLKIMFPMVSSIDEIYLAREHVESAIAGLARDGYEFNSSPKLGAMIELPSAVEIAEELAAELDFLSIGTNDLIMYLLAVDRTNGRLSELYRSYHPSVLRTISSLTERVARLDVELSVCGDSAADPVMLPFYLGLNIPALSVSPDDLTRVRKHLASIDALLVDEVHDTMLSIRRLTEMDLYVRDLRSRIEARVEELFPREATPSASGRGG